MWCDVLPMDSGDIVLGRPWMQDKNPAGMWDNTCMVLNDGKPVTLRPKWPEPPKKESRAHITKEMLQVHRIYGGNTTRTQV